MTITTLASETYNVQQKRAVDALEFSEPVREPAVESIDCSPISCPKLFWAGAALFAANLAVLFGVVLSPELRVGLYGAERPGAYTVTSVDKPSPFTPVVEEGKPRKVKLAQRLRPILYQEPVEADSGMAPTDLAIPRASQTAAVTTVNTAPSVRTVTGDAVYRQVENYGEFRRVTAASQELIPPTPRRVSN
jgi:hypothetical protein